MKELYFKDISGWCEWLKNNYDNEKGAWLIFFNKKSKKPSIGYDDAVDEALCYGWIDSLIKNIDKERYARKFTPRKEISKWSTINKKRIERLIKENRMFKPGLKKVEIAKQNGCWSKDDRPRIPYKISHLFSDALNKNKKAKLNFNNLAPSHKKQYIGWISSAKREETKKKRIEEAVKLLEKDQKLGMK